VLASCGRELEIACINFRQTQSVGKGSDHLQLIKFRPSCTPRKGVCGGAEILALSYYSQRGLFASKGGCGGAKFFAPPYYSQCAVFASLGVLFSLHIVIAARDIAPKKTRHIQHVTVKKVHAEVTVLCYLL